MSPVPDLQTSDDQTPTPSESTGAGALPLREARREAFAQALAAGLTQRAAYERAGYRPWRQAASRLAAKPRVAARIAWLKANLAEAEGSDSETAIVRLLDMADAADLSAAAGIRAAREALEAAWRLHGELCRSRAAADARASSRSRSSDRT